VDVKVATDERDSKRTAKVVWSWRPTLALSFAEIDLRSDGGKRARLTGGERAISRKPLRREGRIASADLYARCVFFYVHFAHETAVQRAPGFPAPPLLRGLKKFTA